MKEKVLHIVDSYATGYFHEFFNAGLLVACCQVTDQVIYHANKSSRQCVLSLIEKKGYKEIISKVEQRSIYVVREESSWGALLRTFVSAFLNVFYLFVGGRGPIIFMHNDAFSIYWLNFFNFFLKRPVWIVCHGELELLISSPHWYKPSFLYKYLFRFFFRHVRIARNTHFIVLGYSIADNLKGLVTDESFRQFAIIEHPYFFDKEVPSENVAYDRLSIGTVGTMNEFKGYYRLQELVNLLTWKIKEEKLNISVVGRLENVNPVHQDLINYSTLGNELLPRERFAELVHNLDYVLFLYATDSYKLIASGAIFDAISFGKPIIALKNDYFVSIFEQCGEMGYLCDSLDEIYNLILNILNNPNMSAYKYFLAICKRLERYLLRKM